jgi:dTDP-4-dehydrorhamnose 3,5-epimerase
MCIRMSAMSSTTTGLEVSPAGLKDSQTVDRSGRELFGQVEGVEVTRLNEHADGRGSLTPFLSLADSFWREPVVYAYSVKVRPGKIKGWGMHRLQTDRYFVPACRLRVVLYDGRVDSPTFESFQEIWFSDGSSGLVRIPPGVWHADQNWGDCDAWLVNFPTRPYDPADPDKYRLDPHGEEIAFDWTIRDG